MTVPKRESRVSQWEINSERFFPLSLLFVSAVFLLPLLAEKCFFSISSELSYFKKEDPGERA